MHPLIRAGLVCTIFAAAGSRAGGGGSTGRRAAGQGTEGASAPGDASPASGMSAVCPLGSLPDGEACVPLPPLEDPGGEELLAYQASHHDKKGRFEAYEQIPRRPDRPAGYDAYQYPVPTPDRGRLLMSGYDLDKPDDEQRRGRKLSHVGHGGIDLDVPRGTEVRLLTLEHQEGDAEVLYVGKLFGTTVVTRHTLREGGKLRDYVVLYGHLEAPAPGLAVGQSVPLGSLLGYVGDTGSQGIVHLHLEVRQVRDGVEGTKIPPARLVANEVAVVCDPRNVLPVK